MGDTAPGRITVVGLGPAGTDLLLPAARAVLERAPRRFARTARHPTVAALSGDGLDVESFDSVYDAGTDLDVVYASIVEALVAAASTYGEVAYAVPGSPAVAEQTVALLHEAAREGQIELDVVPGLSFADFAWARLGIDPMATGARVLDGRELDPSVLDTGGPVLVAQSDSPLVLSDVKLALLERIDADEPVVLLHHLGLPDEDVREVPLAELDRAVAPDHLTAVVAFVPGGGAARELARLLALAEKLRGPGGCPWDAEQTHHSLTRYLLEESYEVVEAVEQLPPPAPELTSPDDPAYARLVDELGDLLYQVIFHAVLAQEAGAFAMADVAQGIHDKLVRRHPHVFGDVDADTSAAVMANWEQIKKEEKGEDSIVAGITPGLPSLLYAHKLLRKAASVGLDPGDRSAALARITTAADALRDEEDAEAVLGYLLAATVSLARSLGVDAESALRGWAARFKSRFEAMERLAHDRALDLHELLPEAVEALWSEAADPDLP